MANSSELKSIEGFWGNRLKSLEPAVRREATTPFNRQAD
jgi:hypothetical protein